MSKKPKGGTPYQEHVIEPTQFNEPIIMPLVQLEKGPEIGNTGCEMTVLSSNAAPRRCVENHRQCPICHHGDLNGVGTATSTQGSKRYYKCDRCGHTWTAIVSHRVERVEHRDVNIQTRDV